MGRTRRICGDDAVEFRPERWLEFISPPSDFFYPSLQVGPRLCLEQRLVTFENYAWLEEMNHTRFPTPRTWVGQIPTNKQPIEHRKEQVPLCKLKGFHRQTDVCNGRNDDVSAVQVCGGCRLTAA
ncbi:hypothetical protein BJ742DRAFT_160025 [Cladochytrium replicatum]|nr:hypothetical protein BJ742DRAFT_160025 [Cladochytrium replicatum]